MIRAVAFTSLVLLCMGIPTCDGRPGTPLVAGLGAGGLLGLAAGLYSRRG